MGLSWEQVLLDISKEPNIDKADMDVYFRDLAVLSSSKKEVVFLIDPFLKNIINNKNGKIYTALKKVIDYHYSSNVKLTFTTSKKNFAVQDSILKHSAIGLNQSLTFSNFLYTDNSIELVKKAKYIADSQKPFAFPIFIFGPPGCGKTHLVNAIGNQINATKTKKILYLQANDLAEDVIRNRDDVTSLLDKTYYNQDVLIVDDFQNLERKDKTRDYFFQVFEKFKTSGKILIVTSDKRPSELNVEERIFSRLQEGLTIEMHSPDIQLKKSVFLHLIEKNELSCSDDVAKFIAQNASNLRELTGYVNNILTDFIMLDSQDSKLQEEEITMSLALKTVRINDLKNVSLDRILSCSAEYFGVSTASLKENKRTPEKVYQRRIVIYLADKLTLKKQKDLARFLNYKDHTAITQSLKKISLMMNKDKQILSDIEQIEIKIKSSTQVT